MTTRNEWRTDPDQSVFDDTETLTDLHVANREVEPRHAAWRIRLLGLALGCMIAMTIAGIAYKAVKSMGDSKPTVTATVTAKPGPRPTVTRTVHAPGSVVRERVTVRATATRTRVTPGPTKTVSGPPTTVFCTPSPTMPNGCG